MTKINSITTLGLFFFLLMSTAFADIGDGSKTIATAGVRGALSASSLRVVWVTVQCAVDNTGNCFVGGPLIADGRGVELSPGEAYMFPPMGRKLINYYDLGTIFADVQTNGEIVTFIYYQR